MGTDLWMWPQEEPGPLSGGLGAHRLGDSTRLPNILTGVSLDMCQGKGLGGVESSWTASRPSCTHCPPSCPHHPDAFLSHSQSRASEMFPHLYVVMPGTLRR